jgi:hypothetical protein
MPQVPARSAPRLKPHTAQNITDSTAPWGELIPGVPRELSDFSGARVSFGEQP